MTTLDKYQIALVDTGDTVLQFPVNGFTADTAFDCRATPPLTFVTPSNWLAATVTFSALPFLLKGVNYLDNAPANAQLAPVYDETGTGVVYAVVTQNGYGFYSLPPTLFNSVRYINITSSVIQTAGPTVTLALTPLWQGIHS
jgi:hypothetical protein